MGDRVIVLGAGVAGLTAAHELAERGFEVTVYERRPVAGGKARSFPATIRRIGENPGAPEVEQSKLPGEHGFRFFPGFYRHVFDTMQRIPVDDRRVCNNLKDTQTILLLQVGKKENEYPTQFWRVNAMRSWRPRLVPHPFTANVDMPPKDARFFARYVIYQLLKACPERRFGRYEADGWWEFSQAGQRSPLYRKMMKSLTRSLVAAQAEELSVRTGGYIMLTLAWGGFSWRGRRPKVLNGPTDDAWIRPWRKHLERKNVRFEFNTSVEALRVRDGKVDEVILSRDGRTWSDQARWYVAALPVDSMKKIVRECPDLLQAEPRLGNLEKLKFRWMNGIMIYLRESHKMVRGHTIYIDSPWALTSISQAQFWPGTDLGELSDGRVNGILSVDISDWDEPGLPDERKPAKECTDEEIFHEVCKQIRQHTQGTGYERMLEPANIYGWCLDPDVSYMPDSHQEFNLEELLINTPGSWENRPPAVIAIENLFLAGDYVRTYTDLATMEAANESARRAVNGILLKSGQPGWCDVWPRTEFTVLAPLRWLDRRRFKGDERYEWARQQLAELKPKRS